MQTKFKFFLLFSLSFLMLNSFAQPKKVAWAERDAFHKVMAQTFHPVEEGNFEPIRSRSGEMVEKAVAWSKSAVPAELDKKKIAPVLKKLVKGSKTLHKAVKAKASDAELTKQLTALHDVFHEIVGLCRHDDNH